jgi:excisionase family DNA binding protein
MTTNSPTSENQSEKSALPKLTYTMAETAEVLGVSYITVHRLLKRGLLRSSNALRHKLIPHSEIDRFLKMTVK